ncbi:MAG: hypothetical protein VX768_12885 [Planctomycetota bacterium]|nr:hypothetical protein [Planctomycetota bacterium]
MTGNENMELRKAAILIESLDPESVRLLLRQLHDKAAQQVLQSTRQLGSVSSREKEMVLTEFLMAVQGSVPGADSSSHLGEEGS